MSRHNSRQKLSQFLLVEHLERRDVPAMIYDFDLVRQNAADFRDDSLLLTLTTPIAPDFSVGAYAPGLQLIRNYHLVPNLYEAKIQGATLLGTLEKLEPSLRVAMVQPNAKIQAAGIPNDPSFSKLYGLNNTGQTGGKFDADIDATEAWDTQTGTGRTIVAILDTGVDYNHPDLRDNIWTNTGEVAGNGIDDDHNGFIDDVHGYNFVTLTGDPMDDNGHGTHVAGTIGAVGDNGIGVAGVNWHTRLMALKFLDSTGSGYLADAIAALDYAVQMGARISNNSWGGGGYEATLGQALARATVGGHIFVAAAGNSSSNNDVTAAYPANYNSPNVVSVAAVDQNGVLASFSNYGPTSVDIAAPGVNIYSTLPGGTYGSYSGTSMATPHVTGALSLYLDAHPGASATEALSALYQSADSLTSLQNRVAGGRRLNVGNMFTQLAPPVSDPQGARVVAGQFNQAGGSITSASLTFSEEVQPSSFSLADVSLVGPLGTLAISSVTTVTGSGNKQFTITFAPISQAGNYRLGVGPAILDLTGNYMDQNVNGFNGELSDLYTLDWTQQVQTVFTNNSRVAIRDLRTVTSTITVDADLIIGDLNVRMDASHTYVSDMVITLTSPTNVVYTLFNRRGTSGDNLIGTVFDDQAAVGIAEGLAPFTGAFRPEGSLTSLVGKNARGKWTLSISDKASRDSGTLQGWSLEFTQQLQGSAMPARRLAGSQLAKAQVALVSVALPVGPMWTGGALLSANQPLTPVPDLHAAHPMAVANTAAALQARLDMSVWSRFLADETGTPWSTRNRAAKAY